MVSQEWIGGISGKREELWEERQAEASEMWTKFDVQNGKEVKCHMRESKLIKVGYFKI